MSERDKEKDIKIREERKERRKVRTLAQDEKLKLR